MDNYIFKDGNISDKTKKEQTFLKDPFFPNQYIDLFKKYDIPFLYEQWNDTLRSCLKRVQSKETLSQNVFGRYLSKMKLLGYRHFTFKDTLPINQYRLKLYYKEEENE